MTVAEARKIGETDKKPVKAEPERIKVRELGNGIVQVSKGDKEVVRRKTTSWY